MQEEIEQRTITLAVSAAKFTGRELKDAITRFMQKQQAQKTSKQPAPKAGRVSMKQLQKQYGELRSVTISDDDTRKFERIARKYHVQYKVFRCEKGKYQIFFKAPNAEAMETAFNEYAVKKLRAAEKEKPSVLKMLHDLQAQRAPEIGEKIRQKDLER